MTLEGGIVKQNSKSGGRLKKNGKKIKGVSTLLKVQKLRKCN